MGRNPGERLLGFVFYFCGVASLVSCKEPQAAERGQDLLFPHADNTSEHL